MGKCDALFPYANHGTGTDDNDNLTLLHPKFLQYGHSRESHLREQDVMLHMKSDKAFIMVQLRIQSLRL